MKLRDFLSLQRFLLVHGRADVSTRYGAYYNYAKLYDSLGFVTIDGINYEAVEGFWVKKKIDIATGGFTTGEYKSYSSIPYHSYPITSKTEYSHSDMFQTTKGEYTVPLKSISYYNYDTMQYIIKKVPDDEVT